MLWSLLLYAALMLVFNWDEIRRSARGNDGVTIVNTDAGQTGQTQAGTAHSRAAKTIIAILRTVSGFTVRASADN